MPLQLATSIPQNGTVIADVLLQQKYVVVLAFLFRPFENFESLELFRALKERPAVFTGDRRTRMVL